MTVSLQSLIVSHNEEDDEDVSFSAFAQLSNKRLSLSL